MREIKFRAWDKRDVENPPSMSYFDLSEGNMYKRCGNIMQYTGLKDKNGKEIYEGDILKTVGNKFNGKDGYKDVVHISSVEWWQSFSNIGYRLKNSKGKTIMIKPSALVTMKAEIIGNIYENPELL